MERTTTAYELIEENKLDEAMTIAQELIAEQEVDGYLIKTDIHQENEEIGEAIETLQQALELFPDNWILWMRLGNFQSDIEEYEDAAYSLERAQYLTGAEVNLIKLNKAILAIRTNDYQKAGDLITDFRTDFPLDAIELELKILTKQQAYRQVIEHFEAQLLEENDPDNAEPLAQILYFVGYAHFMLGNRGESERYMQRSLNQNRRNDNALWLRRELFGTIHKENKLFHLLINGSWRDEEVKDGELRFFVPYGVVAKNESEALEEVKRFEPMDLDKESFQIDEFKKYEMEEDNPSGIYYTDIFHLYPIEEE